MNKINLNPGFSLTKEQNNFNGKENRESKKGVLSMKDIINYKLLKD